MPDGSGTLTLTLQKAIADIPAVEWNACAGGGNPFVSHAFLSAVEDSGSANARTGWLPQHAVLRSSEGHVVAVAPMYAKSHSYGEYVFDHGWASAFERAGGDYYPKLQVAVPFSPVPGPRLLVRPGAGVPAAALAGALSQACRELDLSSVHVTFCTESDWTTLGEAGWLQRLGMQFHWENAGYATFDDFLGALSSRKRKVLRRERRDANNAGLEFITLRGPEITRAQWDAFYGFYTSTVDRKWGSAYLTRAFFPLLSERLGEAVVLMLALKGGKPVAGALNLMGDEALYGRNWGCRGDFPFLHFELCYYRAIDFAIAHGLSRVEAGAQGEHKIQRGYLPRPTYSAHWIAHGGLRRAVAEFLTHERAEKLTHMEELAAFSPFRRDDGGADQV
ncbi:GNAT family N-acetyltransferase [Limobrevibacterium gyesilva]|uniref:GNAT family N-acetyltransferase n=1 Tax=Limobrevibacterium gyesilva TaxID=2991712 RepID=A0AA42CDW0_9PROT|nr:GNAT family N-acetyltransferase [Limobrevibacterium gyesilva]MCW3474439.1 GNAT family N-acetyltransferase [Limobrevibacterium gyesilva]